MVRRAEATCTPDYATPPGATIQDSIDALGWTQGEAATRLGISQKTLSLIIHGKAPITHDTAILLERVIGGTASFWRNREEKYQLRLAALKEKQRLYEYAEWLKTIPVKELAARGYVRMHTAISDQVQEILSFFQVASPEAFANTWLKLDRLAAYRSSEAHPRSPEAVAAWVRSAQVRASQVDLPAYSKTKFRESLKEIRKLCVWTPEEAWPQMVDLCARAGVALVFIPEYKGTVACGAAFWMDERPCIVLSGRYKTDDHFWFTFFHEAAHVGLHPKRSVFVDDREDPESNGGDVQEAEANKAAREYLISSSDYEALLRNGIFVEHVVRAFAREVGVSPGVVVGRLQRDKAVPYRSTVTRLKHSIDLSAFTA